jgi:hypothetical protein
MKAEDVKKALEMAIAVTGVKHVHVYHRPSLLSDNVLNLESSFFFGYTDPCSNNSLDQTKTQVASTVVG